MSRMDGKKTQQNTRSIWYQYAFFAIKLCSRVTVSKSPINTTKLTRVGIVGNCVETFYLYFYRTQSRATCVYLCGERTLPRVDSKVIHMTRSSVHRTVHQECMAQRKRMRYRCHGRGQRGHNAVQDNSIPRQTILGRYVVAHTFVANGASCYYYYCIIRL